MNKDIINVFEKYPEETKRYEGATPEEINQVQKILGCNLPLSYKNFLSTLGAVKFFGEFIFGINNKAELLKSSIILGQTQYPKNYLPNGLVVIEDNGEFIYCLDTNKFNEHEECPVVKCHHLLENTPYGVIYNDFSEFFLSSLEDALDDYLN